MRVLVTGGRGFIGSNLLKIMAGSCEIIVVDAETYAARPWLAEPKHFRYEKMDIRDQASVAKLMQKYRPDHVMHLAAESHVCRSISGPKDFVTTNVNGTFNLLQEFLNLHQADKAKRFLHVSTDEVFGELKDSDPAFTEQSPMLPRSPYAASKASSDALALAYWHTYELPVIVTNCSNNYGVNQHPEKLIPKTIGHMLRGEPVTVYGSGTQVRDWIHVEDHCTGLLQALAKGRLGERYLFGGACEMKNIEVIRIIDKVMNYKVPALPEVKISYTFDRPHDDQRYAINFSKANRELGWTPREGSLEKNITAAVDWYIMSLGAKVEHKADRSTDGEVKWV